MLIADIDRKEFICIFESYFADLTSKFEGITGDAMRYATLDGGKRIRPLCVYLGALSVGGNVSVDDILPLASAIELVHSYSLVHDDMPEMDNDDMRRGKPSVHKKFGSATALLAGDGLLTFASCEMLKANPEAAQEISHAALDMVFGQSAELAGCKTEDQWLDMYAKKTGALISGAFCAGAIYAGADECQHKFAAGFSKCIGISFQLQDDLLDGDASIIDAVGIERTRALLDKYTTQAMEYADKLQNSTELIAFAKELWHRKV